MKKQKLCYIIPRYDQKTSTHYAHIYQFLGLLGKKIDVFLYAESGDPSVRIPHLAGFYVQPRQVLPTRIAVRLWWFLKLRLSGYRIFYCHYAELSTIVASLITRVCGGKTYKWHCAQEHHYKKPWSFTHLAEKFTREIPFSLSLRLADFLVTCSPLLQNYYRQQFGIEQRKIIVIPAMVDIGAFQKGEKKKLKKELHLPEKPIALFVHRLSKRKGADRLIELAKQIKTRRMRIHILVVGNGPLESYLKSSCERHRLRAHLTLIGGLPNLKLPQYYHASDVFIMPSRIEEFGRVLVEAMAAGLPIVATETLGANAVLTRKQQQFMVSQKNYLRIPELIGTLLKDKNLYRALVKEGITRAGRFSTNKVATKFMKNIIKI